MWFCSKMGVFGNKLDIDVILLCDLDIGWPWNCNQTTGRPCVSYKWHNIFDCTSSGSNVMHTSRLLMFAGRHVGFAWKSGICHGGIYGDFQLWTGRVQMNWFQVRNLLLQFCPTSVYISSFVYPTICWRAVWCIHVLAFRCYCVVHQKNKNEHKLWHSDVACSKLLGYVCVCHPTFDLVVCCSQRVAALPGI